MELKVIVGQICMTAVAITCVITKTDHGLLYLAFGALAASIGYPFIVDLKKET